MTFIIHARGFDLENELQLFVEACLRTLLSLPVKISEVRVTLGSDGIDIRTPKCCQLYLMAGNASHSIIQYAASYEEAVLRSVQEMKAKMHKLFSGN